MLAAKFFDDQYYNNAFYAKVCAPISPSVCMCFCALFCSHTLSFLVVDFMFLHVHCVGVSLSFPALPQCPLSCVCVCVCVCPQVGGVPPGEMNGLELEFLFSINFSMAVSTEVYAKYNAELVAHVNKPSAGHSCPCRTRAHAHTPVLCV